MLKTLLFAALCLLSAGCAVTTVYDPLKNANNQTLLLNSELAQVKIGMTSADVHDLMGEQLIVGYSYQNPLPDESSPLAIAKDVAEKPITILNPYKVQDRITRFGACHIEYYVTSIQHPDGVISDDELLPLIFCGGVLKAKGWDHLQ